jgi:hypothetical protein
MCIQLGKRFFHTRISSRVKFNIYRLAPCTPTTHKKGKMVSQESAATSTSQSTMPLSSTPLPAHEHAGRTSHSQTYFRVGRARRARHSVEPYVPISPGGVVLRQWGEDALISLACRHAAHGISMRIQGIKPLRCASFTAVKQPSWPCTGVPQATRKFECFHI